MQYLNADAAHIHTHQHTHTHAKMRQSRREGVREREQVMMRAQGEDPGREIGSGERGMGKRDL